MKINRIAFTIDKDSLNESQLKNFNKLSSYFEELIFYYLPSKTEIGGYGFINIRFDPHINETTVNPFGQIIQISSPISKSDLNSLITNSIDKQIQFLGKELSLAIKRLSTQMDVDSDKVIDAISRTTMNANGFEQRLKVSKSHKNRILKVDLYRIVEPNIENVICRIKYKADKIIEEFELLNNSTCYDISHELKKSKWRENTLVIFNRHDEESHLIDVSKHIKKAPNNL